MQLIVNSGYCTIIGKYNFEIWLPNFVHFIQNCGNLNKQVLKHWFYCVELISKYVYFSY